MKCPCCAGEVDRIDPLELPKLISLPRQESIVYDILARNFGRFVPVYRIVDELYIDDVTGGPLTAHDGLKVRVCYLRKVVGQYGFKIERSGYGGYGRMGSACSYALQFTEATGHLRRRTVTA